MKRARALHALRPGQDAAWPRGPARAGRRGAVPAASSSPRKPSPRRGLADLSVTTPALESLFSTLREMLSSYFESEKHKRYRLPINVSETSEHAACT